MRGETAIVVVNYDGCHKSTHLMNFEYGVPGIGERFYMPGSNDLILSEGLEVVDEKTTNLSMGRTMKIIRADPAIYLQD